MKPFLAIVCSLGLLSFSASHALASGWQLAPATAEGGLQLRLIMGKNPVYLFECQVPDVQITNFGVTELLDIQTGNKIADEPGAVITPGASVMALYTGKGDPDFVPAVSKPNAVKGWDLSIRLSLTDKRLQALGKTDMISLFTTGQTMAVNMDSDDKALARDFLKQCKSANK
jgi:hypothetical protein